MTRDVQTSTNKKQVQEQRRLCRRNTRRHSEKRALSFDGDLQGASLIEEAVHVLNGERRFVDRSVSDESVSFSDSLHVIPHDVDSLKENAR